MNKFTKIMIPVVAIALGFTSCDKTPTTTTPTPTIDTPQTNAGPTPVTPNVGNGIWGVMVALEMRYSFNNPQLPVPVTTTSDIGVATFYDSDNGSGNIVDAGKVSVNSNDLEKQTNNSYTLTATTGLTPSSLNLGSNVQWDVAGGSGIPSINYSHSGTFPAFQGSIPTEVNRSAGFEIDLGSDVVGADSVYVVIVTSSKTITKAYTANPAPNKIKIDASELSSLPAIDDNTAYIEVLPFTYKIETLNSKRFVFIKEQAVVVSANIK